MMEIPGGTIELRDARTGGTREVTLAAFELGRTAVTRSEYRLESGGSGERTEDAPAHPVTWFEAVRWCNAASVVAGLRPAYAIDAREVAWDAASDGYRLPTEAEWEWACRADVRGPLPLGWTPLRSGGFAPDRP